MNCKNCGYPLTENDAFCQNCGTAVNNMNEQPMSNSQPMGTPMPNGGMNNPQPMPNQVSNMGMPTQPNYYQNQGMNNPNGMQPNYMNNNQNYYAPNKSNKTLLFVILGVIVLAVIILLIVLLTKGNNGETGGGGNGIVSTATHNVSYKGFTFKVPNDLKYDISSDSISIGDESDQWLSRIEVLAAPYSNFVAKKNNILPTYNSKGYNARNLKSGKRGGVDMISFEVTYSGTNAIIALADGGSTYTFGVTSFNSDNEIDYDLLDTVAKILATAKYTGESNSISTNINNSFEPLNELEEDNTTNQVVDIQEVEASEEQE